MVNSVMEEQKNRDIIMDYKARMLMDCRENEKSDEGLKFRLRYSIF